MLSIMYVVMYADDTCLSSVAQDPDILEFKKLPFDNMMC